MILNHVTPPPLPCALGRKATRSTPRGNPFPPPGIPGGTQHRVNTSFPPRPQLAPRTSEPTSRDPSAQQVDLRLEVPGSRLRKPPQRPGPRAQRTSPPRLPGRSRPVSSPCRVPASRRAIPRRPGGRGRRGGERISSPERELVNEAVLKYSSCCRYFIFKRNYQRRCLRAATLTSLPFSSLTPSIFQIKTHVVF